MSNNISQKKIVLCLCISSNVQSRIKLDEKYKYCFVTYINRLHKFRDTLRLKIWKEGKKMQCLQDQRGRHIAYNLFLVKCYFAFNKFPLSNKKSRMKENRGKLISLLLQHQLQISKQFIFIAQFYVKVYNRFQTAVSVSELQTLFKFRCMGTREVSG